MPREDVKLGFLIKRAHLKFEGARNRFYQQYDLTGSQVDVLEFLLTRPDQPVTISEIVAYLQVSYATTSGLLTRLEHKGFIQKVTNDQDKRIVLIKLINQDKLQTIFTAEHEYLKLVDQKLTQDFSEAEFNTFVQLLRKLATN